jgi:hypothetical protein
MVIRAETPYRKKKKHGKKLNTATTINVLDICENISSV